MSDGLKDSPITYVFWRDTNQERELNAMLYDVPMTPPTKTERLLQARSPYIPIPQTRGSTTWTYVVIERQAAAAVSTVGSWKL